MSRLVSDAKLFFLSSAFLSPTILSVYLPVYLPTYLRFIFLPSDSQSLLPARFATLNLHTGTYR